MENENPQQLNNLKQRILDRIREKNVTMRSGWYFALKTAAVVATAGLALLSTVFICNIIVFNIRLADHIHFIDRGPGEVSMFFLTFPWIFLAFDIGLMILLQQLLKEFRFGYRVPVAYVFLVIIGLAVALSLFLDQGIHVNDRLEDEAHHHMLPQPINIWYDRTPAPRIHVYQIQQ